MSDKLIHLNRVHADGHSKYVYFLLAATGAALGYALGKLDSTPVDCTVWLGLAAIASWLLSFWLGCKHVTSIQSAIWLNAEVLQLEEGTHPNQPSSMEATAIAKAAAASALEARNNRAAALFNWQFKTLALGVLLFTAWRVVFLLGGHASAS
ncbi:hypothetical protein [Pseudoxanthomonas sp.]|uniref:hypothetical protein n=1 Tax=Pseudoxanthomonas sp. TaxID=1871049 RepID=UPI00258302A5|nr:hypothetical protein [Pseudoxanthomonas sp.]MCR6686073.1 hypothetical protein [Pseudoxanthomonas sp.]